MRRVALLTLGGAWIAAGCMAPPTGPEERPVARAAAPDERSITDHLAKAADCLDRGDDRGALPHLEAHVAAHPDAVMIRAYLAELLYRLDQPEDATAQFARVVADAQRDSGAARKHLVHCHTRLMELAQKTDDRYAEELHRGIGLLLLVRKWDAEPDRHDDAAAERTLTKAAAALRAAREERPGDPRANCYLAEVYERLGQPTAAAAARRMAKTAMPDVGLTATERERLMVEPITTR